MNFLADPARMAAGFIPGQVPPPRQVKAAYDPENTFRVNHNITPITHPQRSGTPHRLAAGNLSRTSTKDAGGCSNATRQWLGDTPAEHSRHDETKSTTGRSPTGCSPPSGGDSRRRRRTRSRRRGALTLSTLPPGASWCEDEARRFDVRRASFSVNAVSRDHILFEGDPR
jgi:hypothetical protein